MYIYIFKIVNIFKLMMDAEYRKHVFNLKVCLLFQSLFSLSHIFKKFQSIITINMFNFCICYV